MGFNTKYKPNQLTLAATATTAVVAGTTIGATAFLVERLAPGYSVAAQIDMVVNTTNLTLAPKWQGSVDGTTWQDLFMMNSAANVATAAGTGSNVTTSRTILTPAAVPFRYLRAAILTGGATAHATNDTYAVKYHWVEKDFL